MDDRELLERAARAAGHNGFSYEDGRYWVDGPMGQEGTYPVQWNPLEDDGDAFRLMVALNISPEVYRELSVAEACTKLECFYEKFGDDISAESATRRAIVRAAAAMEAP